VGRWLGIDHGLKRVGIAVAGEQDPIATPVEVIPAQPLEACLDRIAALAGEYQADGIVVGLPLNMDGSEGKQAGLARSMARALAQRTALDVRLWDERLSSFAADKALAGRLTREKRRARQDALAASAILSDFLEANGPKSAPSARDEG